MLVYEQNEGKLSEKMLTRLLILLKSTNTVYYFDEICDVAERMYGFENTATRSYLDFCINFGFITPINSGDKLSFRVIL